MESLSVFQLVLRLVLALAVVLWGWYTPPLQQFITGCAAGILLLTAVKPAGRLAALLDVLAVSALQVYSLAWLPLSAWMILTHRRYSRSVAMLAAPAPLFHACWIDPAVVWWALLGASVWVSMGFMLAEKPITESDEERLFPLPDDLREQWEQEREVHRQLRYQYQEMAGAHRELLNQLQIERARQQILQAAMTTDEPQEAVRHMLLVLRECTGVSDGACWLIDGHTRSLRLIHATDAGSLPREIALSSFVRLQAEELPMRKVGEQLQIALTSERNDVLVAVLHEEKTVFGAVALFGWQGTNETARQRLQSLQPTLSMAVRALLRRRILQQENYTLTALYEIGSLFLSTQSIEVSSKKLVSIVAELLEAPFVTLYLRDIDTGQFGLVANVGEAIQLMEGQHFGADEGIAGWIAQSGQPIHLPNTSTEPRLIGYASKRMFASLIGAPLRVRARVDGVLLAAHTAPGYFDGQHLNQLVSAANQFAQVLEISRLTRSVGLLAITDGLTGLYNRRYMEIRLEEEVHRAQRYHNRFCVMLVDIDHFKQINDTLGHATGDLVLQKVAQQAQSNLRETELLFRYGGEEFCAILPETSMHQAEKAGERLRAAVENAPFTTVDGISQLRVTVSVGIAEFPTHGQDKATLLAAADEALYLAKRGGRNRVESTPRAA